MPERLKEFFDKLRGESREKKLRIAALAASVIFLFAGLVYQEFGDGGEEVAQTSPPPSKVAEKKAEEGGKPKVIPIVGAKSGKIFVRDPFAVPDKPPERPPEVPEKVSPPPPTPPTPSPEGKIILVGTSMSGDKKFAVVKRADAAGKTLSQEVILSVGDSFDGRRVAEIGQNFLVFDDGTRLEP